MEVLNITEEVLVTSSPININNMNRHIYVTANRFGYAVLAVDPEFNEPLKQATYTGEPHREYDWLLCAIERAFDFAMKEFKDDDVVIYTTSWIIPHILMNPSVRPPLAMDDTKVKEYELEYKIGEAREAGRNITVEPMPEFPEKVRRHLQKLLSDISIVNKKTFSCSDPAIIDRSKGGPNQAKNPDTITVSQPQVVADWSADSAFHMSIEPDYMAPCQSQNVDGFYIGKLMGDKLESGKTTIRLGMKLSMPIPIRVIALIKNGKLRAWRLTEIQEKIKHFSFNIEGPESSEVYLTALIPDVKAIQEVDGIYNLIGGWLSSSMWIHFFHLSTDSYAAHMALESYYDDIVDISDSLAESVLSQKPALPNWRAWQSSIVPEGCPIAYLNKLISDTNMYMADNEVPDDLQSLFHDAINCAKSCIYKLTKLH